MYQYLGACCQLPLNSSKILRHGVLGILSRHGDVLYLFFAFLILNLGFGQLISKIQALNLVLVILSLQCFVSGIEIFY